MPQSYGDTTHVKSGSMFKDWLTRLAPRLLDILLHPMVTVVAFCVAGVLAAILFDTILAFLAAAVLCKLFTMAGKNAALVTFQIAKGIGNGLVSRSEIADVAMCADDGHYAAHARMDLLATCLVVGTLVVLVLQV